MAEHSRTPWNVIEGDKLLIGDSQALTILDCATPSGARQRIAEANAAFICKAVNSHEALVTALRRIRSLEEKNVLKYAQQIADEALRALAPKPNAEGDG